MPRLGARDLTLAVRTWWRRPGFTLVEVIALAVGIGEAANQQAGPGEDDCSRSVSRRRAGRILRRGNARSFWTAC
jgi:hypothetical protein